MTLSVPALCLLLSPWLAGLNEETALSVDKPGGPAFTGKPQATRSVAGKVDIAFAVSAPTDVAVAVLDAQGKIVRHLAAGMLGGAKPPPAPLKSGLSQTIEWDMTDDTGKPVLSTEGSRSGDRRGRQGEPARSRDTFRVPHARPRWGRLPLRHGFRLVRTPHCPHQAWLRR